MNHFCESYFGAVLFHFFLFLCHLLLCTKYLKSLTSKYISDEDEQLWVWEYKTDDEGHDLFMDINEEIRFRVVDEVFTDLSPAGPEMSGEKKSTDDTENKRSPYTITVSHFAILKGIEVLK